MVMVLWLVYVEIFKVDAICLRWVGGRPRRVTLLLLVTILWWRGSERSCPWSHLRWRRREPNHRWLS